MVFRINKCKCNNNNKGMLRVVISLEGSPLRNPQFLESEANRKLAPPFELK